MQMHIICILKSYFLLWFINTVDCSRQSQLMISLLLNAFYTFQTFAIDKTMAACIVVPCLDGRASPKEREQCTVNSVTAYIKTWISE